jgi:hypothetical protein
MEAPVMKQASSGIMPGVSSAEAASCLALLVSGSHVDIVAPQDGAGAQAGAPAVSQLTDYYAQMHTALEASIVSGTAQLWTTAETYQAVVPGAESANGWQPAPVSRIRDQLGAESPYVAQIIEFMYGWDMSPEATFTPVEADTLLSQYTGDASGTTSQTGGTVSCSVFPSSSYPDVVPSNLTDGTGGGFGQPLGRDWVGFAGNPPGVVTVTKELGGPKPSQDCPPNKPTEECHPCK